ncbi:unnamed protein product, partial [Closterium sp. NIES-53]
ASVAAALGASAAAALGASASAAPGAGLSPLSGTAPTESFHTFTLDSGASRSFFRDSTTLTPLSQPVAVSLANPSGGPVLAHSSTVLPCPAASTGLLSGLHLPSFSTNLVSGADLQDAWVDQFTPGGQRVTHCTCYRKGRHLATFTRRPGLSLYTLTTAPPPVSASSQIAASSQVFAAASRSSPASAPFSCRPLAHETLLWHHRLGHPSLPRLRGMASRALISGLPRSLPPLPPWPAPTCVPCVEGRQRTAPHSSSFPPTEAPLQTLHMDVWGPARVPPREWYSRRCRGSAGAGAAGGATRAPGGAGAAGGGAGAGAARGAAGAGAAGVAAGAVGAGGAPGTSGGAGAAGGGAGAGGIGAAAGAGAAGGAAGAVGAGGATRATGGAGAARGGAGAGAARGAAGAGAGAAGGAAGAGAGAAGGAAGTGDPGAEGTGSWVLGSPPSPGPPPPFLSPPPVQSQSQLQPAPPLPGPSPYSGPTRGLTERREPESRPVSPTSRSASPVRTVRTGRVSRPHLPPVPGTHSMTLRPSTASQRVPLPSPPASSLPDGPDPESNSLRAASPWTQRWLPGSPQAPSLT